jgi:hypothetical protein
MTTNPDEPVILATLSRPGGEPAGPLLIDGCHRLYQAAVTGQAEIPAFVLTAAETLLIRSDAVLGPLRPAQPPGTAPHPHHADGGDPRCRPESPRERAHRKKTPGRGLGEARGRSWTTSLAPWA